MEKTMGERISALRKQEKLTQEELGERLGVSAQAVSKWENDASAPDISLLLPLADVLKTNVETLLGRERTAVAVTEPVSLDKLIFRIYVDSAAGDRVRVNLPMKLIAVLGDAGLLKSMVPMGKDAMDSVDIGAVLTMVANGVIGELVTVDSAEGDHVRIVVEP